jgi:hypothetical protein
LLDKLLDTTLEETFSASDPLAISVERRSAPYRIPRWLRIGRE